MRHNYKKIFFIIAALYASPPIYAKTIVQIIYDETTSQIIDATGKSIPISQPVNRVISLTPNITELIFSAGAGEKIVGTVEYSDFPEAAKNIPLIGSYEKINFETILKLNPQLIFAWKNGTSKKLINKFKKLGLSVFMIDARTLQKIPQSIELIGKVLQTNTKAKKQAQLFKSTLTELKPIRLRTKPTAVFIQIWDKPLITLNHNTIFSQIISFCGGRNIFAEQTTIAPKITIEAVIKRKPETIISSHKIDTHFWQPWSHIPAVKNNRLYVINPDYTNRATMRTLLAVRKICKILNTP